MGQDGRLIIENKVSWSTLFQALCCFFVPCALLILLVAFSRAEWERLAVLVGGLAGFVFIVGLPVMGFVYTFNAPDMIYRDGIITFKSSFLSDRSWTLKDLYWHAGSDRLYLTKERNRLIRKLTYLASLGHVPYFIRIPAEKATGEFRSHLDQGKRLSAS